LVGEFEAHRLLALDPIRLLERREIEPEALGSALADDRAAFIDQSVDAIDPRTLSRDLAHIDLRRVVGAEHDRLDADAAGIGRQRGAGIAVGRHRDPGDA
jgi:hypothetical protein